MRQYIGGSVTLHIHIFNVTHYAFANSWCDHVSEAVQTVAYLKQTKTKYVSLSFRKRKQSVKINSMESLRTL